MFNLSKERKIELCNKVTAFLQSPNISFINEISCQNGFKLSDITLPFYDIKYNRFEIVLTNKYHTITICVDNNISYINLENNTDVKRYSLRGALKAYSKANNLRNVLLTLDLNSINTFNKNDCNDISLFGITLKYFLKKNHISFNKYF